MCQALLVTKYHFTSLTTEDSYIPGFGQVEYASDIYQEEFAQERAILQRRAIFYVPSIATNGLESEEGSAENPWPLPVEPLTSVEDVPSEWLAAIVAHHRTKALIECQREVFENLLKAVSAIIESAAADVVGVGGTHEIGCKAMSVVLTWQRWVSLAEVKGAEPTDWRGPLDYLAGEYVQQFSSGKELYRRFSLDADALQASWDGAREVLK